MPQITFHAMGSRMLAISDAEESAGGGVDEVPVWFSEWEKVMSRFQEESELQQLNRAHGLEIPVSATLMEALEAALQSAKETNSLVHPLMADAVEASGYDRSFFDMAFVDETPARTTTVPDWRAIHLNRRRGTVRLPANGRVDLGGVAKGWAADLAVRRLSVFGPALVDAGGDLAVSGMRADGSPWLISVDNPFNAEHPLCLLAVCSGGVATSGRDYRVWMRGGELQHHIIDPRTGYPARTDVLTATVAASTARKAEAAAKAMLILGAEAGIRWAEAQENLAALLILEDGTFLQSVHMKEMVWEEVAI
jgi:FAD:protein FMN transferase